MVSGGPNKRGKGDGTVYQRAGKGSWFGTVTIPGSNPRRRATTPAAPTKRAAEKALTDLRRQLLIDGDIITSGQTVGSWIEVWWRTIAVKNIRPRTRTTYRSLIDNHILRCIGHIQLTKLTAAHIRGMAQDLEDLGRSTTTAMQIHRIVGAVMQAAEQEGRVTKNVVKLTKAPRRARPNLAILTAVDGVKVLQAVEYDRLGSRWWAALFTGARQGELLGLELDRVGDDLDLSWQLQRIPWSHGCKTPCERKRGTDCPDRRIIAPADWEHRHLEGGLYLSRPKSNAGYRIIPLVKGLREQVEMRIHAALTEPNPHGLLWTADAKHANHDKHLLPLDGSPIDPSWDSREWHKVLARAGVKDARLHDARHTTASLLLAANVPEPLIIKILGHSTYAQSRSYQNVDRSQLAGAMVSVAKLLEIT
jgi:integrase